MSSLRLVFHSVASTAASSCLAASVWLFNFLICFWCYLRVLFLLPILVLRYNLPSLHLPSPDRLVPAIGSRVTAGTCAFLIGACWTAAAYVYALASSPAIAPSFTRASYLRVLFLLSCGIICPRCTCRHLLDWFLHLRFLYRCLLSGCICLHLPLHLLSGFSASSSSCFFCCPLRVFFLL